ncbi:MAG: hypothetical protein AAF862_08800, partial [Pseudomonadota bacterium]
MQSAATLTPSAAEADTGTQARTWDRGYEIRAIGLLSVGFGLVGLDRFIIYPLFPVMAEDLGMTYQDLGLVTGVLSLTWGLSSVLCVNLSDRLGLKLD